jgi:hypothetical protein
LISFDGIKYFLCGECGHLKQGLTEDQDRGDCGTHPENGINLIRGTPIFCRRIKQPNRARHLFLKKVPRSIVDSMAICAQVSTTAREPAVITAFWQREIPDQCLLERHSELNQAPTCTYPAEKWPDCPSDGPYNGKRCSIPG